MKIENLIYPKHIIDWICLFIAFDELYGDFDPNIPFNPDFIKKLPPNYLVIPNDNPQKWVLTNDIPNDHSVYFGLILHP